MTEEEKKPEPRYCSFCGKSEHDVACIIAGRTAFICGECTQICADLVLKHLWDKATRLQNTIRNIEQNGGIPPVAGISDQEIPTNNTEGK